MRRLLTLFLLLQALLVGTAHAKRPPLQVVVAQPYIEMHSGPGRGYPVVFVVGRDETVTILYRRTEWYRVRAARGQEGWVRRDDLALTKMVSGEPAPIPPYPDFSTHRWEIGAGYGVYNHQNLVTGWVDYGLTNSLDIDVVLQQALGTVDNRYMATVGLRHTFLPEWRWISPTAGIGLGWQYIQEKNPPAPLQNNTQLAYVALGARGFITRRFMWRAEWRKYTAFTNQNQNEEPEEWKVGLAVFW
jgi:uncharacterized protein YgiM (DUF1202 family)